MRVVPTASEPARAAAYQMPGGGAAAAARRGSRRASADASRERASAAARAAAWSAFHQTVVARTREAGSRSDPKPQPLYDALTRAAGEPDGMSRKGFATAVRKLGLDKASERDVNE